MTLAGLVGEERLTLPTKSKAFLQHLRNMCTHLSREIPISKCQLVLEHAAVDVSRAVERVGGSRGRRLRGRLDSIYKILPAGATLRVSHEIIDKLCARPIPQRLPLGHTAGCTTHTEDQPAVLVSCLGPPGDCEWPGHSVLSGLLCVAITLGRNRKASEQSRKFACRHTDTRAGTSIMRQATHGVAGHCPHSRYSLSTAPAVHALYTRGRAAALLPFDNV